MATARFYHGAQRYLLGFETLSRLLFYATCIAGIVLGILDFHWLAAGITLLLWLIRYTVQAIVINQTAKEGRQPEILFLIAGIRYPATVAVVEVQALSSIAG